ncbi:hypothetical protein CANARDRAFT_6566 [[Candida] arabinofermentans NRRL YB-2248]|uniref:Uncharacterized protein n=1 Tax=[Candida] arabinofermentans NRRL YB-2248 TaxID=983967 RepID=A0A1E4T5I6_9ASCO|nr:hypothetical protein CANARDRAFT_6566 [[Candida] arabinofermentans NRRL YB-2248]
MPFRFETELGTSESKSLWTKSIYSLSTVSDVIKFTIRQSTTHDHQDENHEDDVNSSKSISSSEILLTAVNITKTSSLNCCFKSDFFKSFKIEGQLPNQPSEEDNNRARSFSFLINSKNLNVLFKDCGDNTEIFKLLILHDDVETSSRLYSNRLFIEFKTKNEMTKKYQLSFNQGLESFDLKISHIHRSLLNQQDITDRIKKNQESFHDDEQEEDDDNEEEEDRVHHFVIDAKILRRFLAMFPYALEDFKIEALPYARKLLLHGFNRQRVLTSKKLQNLTNQPMNLSILLSLNDMVHDNFLPVSKESKHQVSFRLRDFKTFIQLISSNYWTFNEKSKLQHQQQQHQDDLDSSEASLCEFMFSLAGSPLVFERRYSIDKDNRVLDICTITLILISDAETDKLQIQQNQKRQVLQSRPNSFVLKSVNQLATESHKAPSPPPTTTHHNDEPLFVPMDDDYASQTMNNIEAISLKRRHEDEHDIADKRMRNEVEVEAEVEPEVEPETDLHAAELDREVDSIFWDNSRYHHTSISRVDAIVKDSTKENHIDENDDDDDDDDMLGPTQNVPRVKGIFD